MGEFLLDILKWILILIAGDLLLAMACRTIFDAYFNCKKKFLKEMNPFDKTHGS